MGDEQPLSSGEIGKLFKELLEGVLVSIQDEIKTSNKTNRELIEAVTRLEGSMHHPPCPEMCTLKAELSVSDKATIDKFKVVHNRIDGIAKDHEDCVKCRKAEAKEKHEIDEQERRDKRQFVRNVVAGVLVAAILFFCVAAMSGILDGGVRPAVAVSK